MPSALMVCLGFRLLCVIILFVNSLRSLIQDVIGQSTQADVNYSICLYFCGEVRVIYFSAVFTWSLFLLHYIVNLILYPKQCIIITTSLRLSMNSSSSIAAPSPSHLRGAGAGGTIKNVGDHEIDRGSMRLSSELRGGTATESARARGSVTELFCSSGSSTAHRHRAPTASFAACDLELRWVTGAATATSTGAATATSTGAATATATSTNGARDDSADPSARIPPPHAQLPHLLLQRPPPLRRSLSSAAIF